MEPPPEAKVTLIGVEYTWLKLDGGDLYLTQFGKSFREQLDPENWFAPQWFVEHRVRLEGTSTIYRIATKPVHGRSLNLVVRFSRLGQQIPVEPCNVGGNVQAEFNSPFEEFALVMELRAAQLGSARPRTLTKRPLAIFEPATQLQDWQTGRLESKMAAKQAQHPEVRLDRARQYILLYGWVGGLNAVQATQALGMDGASAEKFLAQTTLRAIEDLRDQGFRVLDIKPEHVILRIRPDGALQQRRDGQPAYALVDYELLERIGQSGNEMSAPSFSQPRSL